MPVLMIIFGLNGPQVSKFFKSFLHLYRDLPVRALDDKGNSRVGGCRIRCAGTVPSLGCSSAKVIYVLDQCACGLVW
jgi:hypothetical protein